MKHKKNTCVICKKNFTHDQLYPLMLVKNDIWNLIQKDLTTPDRNQYVCDTDYRYYKLKLIDEMILQDLGKLSEVEQDVIDSLKENDILTENVNRSYEETLTFGERVADNVSAFGGSWTFIFIFFTFLVGWMILNTFVLLTDQYDPYPYILLNLILSCLAAIQAPIIMMSQNRRSEKDRIEAENDYKINLKAELQIRHINMKLDQFMKAQWQQLTQIQQEQTQIMNEIRKTI